MATIIVKNNGASDVGLEDMGIVVPAGTQIEFVGTDGQFTIPEVTASFDLAAAVAAGTLIINNGTTDLSAVDAAKQITIQTELEDELDSEGSGGGSGVHVGSAPPSSPTEGTLWLKTPASLLYAYDTQRGGKWLSTTRHYLIWGRKGSTKDKYLETVDGVADVDAHYTLVRPATLTALSISAEEVQDNASASLQVRVSGASQHSLSLPDDTKPLQLTEDGLNVNLASGALVQAYIDANKNVKDCLVYAEIAWRHV